MQGREARNAAGNNLLQARLCLLTLGKKKKKKEKDILKDSRWTAWHYSEFTNLALNKNSFLYKQNSSKTGSMW